MDKISKFLISQYYDSEKIRAVLDSFQEILEVDILDASIDMKQGMGINATGYWLELLASRFGFSRPASIDPDGAKYFGMVEGGVNTTGKDTFSRAPFVADGKSVGGGSSVPASDDLFATLTKMIGGKLRSDGSQDNINQILNNVFAGSFVVDNQDMTMTVYLDIDKSANDTSIIATNLSLIPKPVGVGINVIEIGKFGFDGTGKVFDNGYMED